MTVAQILLIIFFAPFAVVAGVLAVLIIALLVSLIVDGTIDGFKTEPKDDDNFTTHAE